MSAPQVNVHPTAIGANVKPHTESRQESYPSSTTATTGHRTDPLHANSPSTKTSTNETQFGRETYPSSTTATTGHHTDSLHNPSSVRTSANETQFGRESYPSSNATTMGHHTDSLHNNSPSVNTSTTTGMQFGRESHPSSNATTMGHHTDSLHNSSPSVNTSTTETHPRKESHPSSTTATMDHHTDSVHNNSPSVKTSTTETPYNGTTEKTNAASSTTNATEGVTAPNNEPYPEQRHAGAVGYGPNYNKGATFTEKLTGLKEEVVGKMTKNPEKVEHGRELRTGAVKKREQEEDLNAPFGKAAEEKEVQHGAVTEDHERVSGPHATEHAKAHDDTLHRSKHGMDDPEHVHATERAATVAPEGTALGDRQKSGIHGHSMKHIG